MHNWSLSRYSFENSVALIGEKGKEKSDFGLCKNDSFAKSRSAALLVLNVFVIGLLFDWGNLMVLIWELWIQLSCLLFLGSIRIALISTKLIALMSNLRF